MNTLFHFLHMVAGAAFTSILVAGVFVAQVLAQTTNHSSTDKMTPPALNPGAPSGSYSISGFDNVNLFNGHLNFHLPLLNVKGRGEAQAQMTLAIEQLWRVRRNVGYMGGDFVDEHYPESKWWTGLKPGYGPGVLQGRVTALQVDECTSLPGVTYPAQMVTRLYFTAPDGSEHEFRDTVYDGRPLNYGPCAAIGNSRGKVFVTNDGSSMTFISNADIKDDSWNTAAIDGLFFPSGYLLMKDGTRYKVEGGYVKAIIDRNGNQLTFAYDNNSSVFEQYDRVIAITDSLNRQVTIEYDVQEGGEYGLCDRITYKGFGGADRVIRVSKKSLGGALRSPDVLPRTLEALFPELEGCNTCYFNPTVVSAVWLPGDRSYKFSYNPYGELAAVQLPTGGVYEYDYGPGVEGDAASGVTLGYDGGATGPSKQIYRRVVEKRIYTSGGVLEGKVRFGPQESWSGGLYTNAGFVSVDRLDGNNVRQARSDHYFYGRASGAGERTDTGYTSWKTGREYQTEYLAANGTTVLRRETRTWQQRAGVSWWAAHAQFYAASTTPDAQPSKDPRVVETVVTLPETNQVFKQTSINPQTGAVAFDQFNNRTDVWEYDFGTDAFIRRTHTDYVTTPAYVNADLNPALGASLRSLPAEQWVSTDIAGDNKVSLTTYGYDQSAPDDCPNIIGRASGYGAGFNVRGNVTSATRYGNPIARTGAVTAVAHFDIAGNVVSATDPNNKTSFIVYADSFSDSNNTRNTYALPKTVTSPAPDPDNTGFGSTTGLVATTVYDFWTGLATSTTDPNGQTTTFDYTDPLDRLKLVTRPDGGSTTYFYDRSLNAGVLSDYVRTVTAIDPSRSIDSYQFFDGLGRPSRTFLSEGGSPLVFLTKDTQYDALGRFWRVSNPYRSNGGGTSVNPSGRWTTTTYDALNRVASVTAPDGAVATTSHEGNKTTVTDPAGKKRSSLSDALGRPTQVTEDATTGGFNYVTTYTYDVLGNLRKMDQGGQQRFFMYDALSRLVRVKHPEQAAGSVASNVTDPLTNNAQWSLAYGYDNNGNVTSRVDARNVTTTYAYDALNRNKTVRYSDGTKDIDRHYDGGINGKGRLWYTNWDPNNNHTRFDTHLAIDEYDEMGRPVQYRQRFFTNGVPSPRFLVTRSYNLAGQVTSQTYPSGHTVTYTYDDVGRVNGLSGNVGDGVSRTYSTGISYSEFGGISREQFGTQTPLYHKLRYNARGQLFNVRLGTGADADSWNRGMLVNHYGSGDFDNWGTSGPNNNGNVLRSHYYVPSSEQADLNNASTYTVFFQDYEYDSLNRLTKVTEKNSTTWAAQYAQKYDYDRWGNRTINTSETQVYGQNPGYSIPETELSVSPLNNNRLGVPAGKPGRMDYDAAGNLTNDTYTSYGSDDGTPTRVYDAEGRLTTAKDGALNVVSSYAYDADGRRVKRKAPHEDIWLVYGADGELLAEYQAGAPPFLATKEYGYRGGELLVAISSGDVQRLRRFVRNLYFNSLSREPSAAELQQKTDLLAQAGVEGEAQLLTAARAVARGLFESSEYVARARTDAEYVSDLYNSYLQRGPDAGGLNFWVSNTQTHGRGATLNAFEVCTEFATLASTVYGTASGGDDQRVETFVRSLYYGALQREPTGVEMQDKKQRLNNAAAVGQPQVIAEARAIGTEIFQSTNYHSGQTDQQYVSDLYEAFLQRAPDGPGLGFWVSNTQTHGREATLNAFKVSIEYGELAGTLYRETFWLVPDHLGTPRMVADRTGSLAGVKRHDYLPFGEELSAGHAGRTAAQGYGVNDNVRQKFTGYERDLETGLDFAQARYYASGHGRFTSVDPLLASGRTSAPQTWNRYSYALNNPLRLTDPSGMAPIVADEADPQGSPPPPPPPPPPIDSSLAGSPAYQQALADAGNINVTATVTDVRATSQVLEGGDGYVNGIMAFINVRITDANGQPLSGLSIIEQNVTIQDLSGSVGVENPRVVTTNQDGTLGDILTSRAGHTTTRASNAEIREQANTQNKNPTHFVTEQTLTIARPGFGVVATANYTRTFSNLNESGKKRTTAAEFNPRSGYFRVTLGPITVTPVTRGP